MRKLAWLLPVGVWLCCLGTTAVAQQELDGIFREETVRDAILGRTPTTAGERELYDFNEDGRLDSADLVALLRILGPLPSAAFETNTSIAFEGQGAFTVSVVFTRDFEGSLNYRIRPEDSTADVPGDAALAGGNAMMGSVAVNGKRSAISPMDWPSSTRAATTGLRRSSEVGLMPTAYHRRHNK